MTEKIGLIKNPLTIIAIFAGIAEVSGTIVLPFIASDNQQLFIYFLIFFPSILVILFFITLNFNNKVLYAPSDYKDEQNYININKYDLSTQKNVEVKVQKNESLDPNFIIINEKLEYLSNQMLLLETSKNQKHIPLKATGNSKFLVTNFLSSSDFVHFMSSKGYGFKIYHSPSGETIETMEAIKMDSHENYSQHKAIWLGTKTSLEIAKEVILLAKGFYPHLEYLHLTEYGKINYVYIGGSTETAEDRYNLKALTDEDFEKIDSISSLKDLHNYIRTFE
ncbi:MAG: hypothetical protein IPL84_18415 [Chitinophagaceae bacterium]|nr:hypothetical protein [Chitinophagaceae bacterium]